MATLTFQHERVNNGIPLVVDTGMDDISWGYILNIAKYPTYGGEVVQLLSVYVDDMTINGTIRSYAAAEEIYHFFMEYFIEATQGPEANAGPEAHFNQVPMVMTYSERQWVFEIQPLHAPGFSYSLEVVAPKWQMQAHIVDRGHDVSTLKELVKSNAEVEANVHGSFQLTGIISPASADPATNPFIAPVTPYTKNSKTGEVEFKPYNATEINQNLGKLGDYYSSFLPSYMKGDFTALTSVIGSKPTFGRPSSGPGEGAESPYELINRTTGGKKG